MKTAFKKGQKVKLAVHVAGLTSYEDAVISRVTKNGVWLDNGEGNDESGPFDPITGEREMVFGSQSISAVKQQKNK